MVATQVFLDFQAHLLRYQQANLLASHLVRPVKRARTRLEKVFLKRYDPPNEFGQSLVTHLSDVIRSQYNQTFGRAIENIHISDFHALPQVREQTRNPMDEIAEEHRYR